MSKRKAEINPIIIIILIVIAILIGKGIYTYGTQETYTVTVNDTQVKRGTGQHPKDKYLVFATTADGQDKVFENTDSIFYLKWDSSDMQAKLKQGNAYNVTTYGFRIPFLSTYENIVEIKEIPKIK